MTSAQPDLFLLAAGGKLTPAQRRTLAPRKGTQPKGYAKPPGSGPAGETCKTCQHICRVETGARKKFRKCALMEAHWTRGPGSDILASAPACSLWQKRESQQA